MEDSGNSGPEKVEKNLHFCQSFSKPGIFWEFVSGKGRIICTFANIFPNVHILGIRVRKRQNNLHFCRHFSKCAYSGNSCPEKAE